MILASFPDFSHNSSLFQREVRRDLQRLVASPPSQILLALLWKRRGYSAFFKGRSFSSAVPLNALKSSLL
jgi:hypothetical protein